MEKKLFSKMPTQRHIVLWVLSLLSLPPLPLPAQSPSGCTDPQALNYDPNATINDGSCIYPPTSYQAVLLNALPQSLEEVSGLEFFGESLWAQTDSGTPQNIRRLHLQTGDIQHQTLIIGSNNIDWEDLACDGAYLYIGDFGNNNGDRDDLRIFKVPLDELDQNAATAQVIAFQYEDQTQFDPAFNQNNYDCEAFFFANDSLHLFTKRWLDQKTYHYVLPAQAGEHTALLRDSFNAQTLITAADIDQNGNILLLGLSALTQNAVLWLLYDYPPGQFFKGNKRRITLGSPFYTGQLEGLCFTSPLQGYLAGEKFGQLSAQLFHFNLNPLLSHASEPGLSANVVTTYPCPFEDLLYLQWNGNFSLRKMEMFNAQGQLLQSQHWENPPQQPVKVSCKNDLSPGMYILRFTDERGRKTSAINFRL